MLKSSRESDNGFLAKSFEIFHRAQHLYFLSIPQSKFLIFYMFYLFLIISQVAYFYVIPVVLQTFKQLCALLRMLSYPTILHMSKL